MKKEGRHITTVAGIESFKPVHEGLSETDDRLLPCPFCGGPSAVRHEARPPRLWRAECQNTSQCGIATAFAFVDKDDAVEVWNRRVKSPGPA